MLQDRINNDLAVILMNVSLSSRKPEADLRMLRSTQERVQRISQYVRTLSEESLDAWKARYETTGHSSN
jgi:two-component sensor histidine kinase